MSTISKTLTVTEAKKHFLELVEGIETKNDTITLTRKGVPTTIMMSLEDYEALLETLEILASPEILESLKKSRKQRKSGRLLDDDEVWG